VVIVACESKIVVAKVGSWKGNNEEDDTEVFGKAKRVVECDNCHFENKESNKCDSDCRSL